MKQDYMCHICQLDFESDSQFMIHCSKHFFEANRENLKQYDSKENYLKAVHEHCIKYGYNKPKTQQVLTEIGKIIELNMDGIGHAVR